MVTKIPLGRAPLTCLYEIATAKSAGAGGWRKLLVDHALLHGIDAAPQGIVLAGYSRRVHWLQPRPGGLEHRVIGELPGPAKGVAWQGEHRVVVACATGELVAFQHAKSGDTQWTRQILWRYPDALARVDTAGSQVAVCSNDGGLYYYQSDLARDSVIYRSTDRLRGALFLDDERLGLGAPWYLGTAGYDGRVSLLPRFGAEPRDLSQGTHLLVDDQRLHHLAGGQVVRQEGERPTPTLFTCGYSGRVLALPFEAQTVGSDGR